PFVHGIGAGGAVAGVLIGSWIGEGIGKHLAARKAAAGDGAMIVIPLDLITSLQVRNPSGVRSWFRGQALLVTTAGGAEYDARGQWDGWQATPAAPRTGRGGDVEVPPEGITVPPRPTPEAC